MSKSFHRGMLKLALVVTALLSSGCGDRDKSDYQPSLSPAGVDQKPTYVVGIHPLHNPQRLVTLYGPIVDYLNRQMPQEKFVLETSRNYEEFEKKLYAGRFAFAMPNPYQTVVSVQYGYRVFGKMGDDENFRGIILVRKDSDIRQVSDLKGKTVAYPAKTALAATMMPQYYLHTHGLDVNRDVVNRYVGSQESSIENVLHGHVDAAATWPTPWRLFMAESPQEASELDVRWQTETLPNNAWVVRQDVAPPVASEVARLLLTLHESEQGREMLERLPVSRFDAANDETYQTVRLFLKRFAETVRPVDDLVEGRP